MTSEYWVWLQQVLGYGSDVVTKVIYHYGSAYKFYLAPDSEKIEVCGLNKEQIRRLHSIPRKKIFGIINDCAKSGINILTPEDRIFPERLLNISDPPSVLYVKGSRFDFNGNPAIAVVGPRKISDYGAGCARTISNTLASCGFTIVSGGAVGGDSAAHIGAIEAGGYTIGVLGAGIMNDYLKCNLDLRERIANNGCLVSEFTPYEGVKKGTFEIRNRIISGLCNGVIIVEAPEGSGTLITARHASEQGRDVFVIPGNPSQPQYTASNRLIDDGAKPLNDINKLISEYIFLYPDKIHEPVENDVDYQDGSDDLKVKKAPIDKLVLSELALGVLEKINLYKSEFTADEIIDNFELKAGDVLTAITELEICGFIESLPGSMFRLK